MTPTQKRTLLFLALIGLAYFSAFILPNAHGARDANMLLVFSQDETITYPYVVHMLVTPQDRHELVWRLFIYGDYHYGYPFYFASMLAVLPVKLIFGEGYTAHMQLNLLLLRQWISVLPMILAAGVLVFMQTGFRSTWRSLGLFALILAIPGVVRNNLWWWHPDALSVLAVALTLFFLTRDRLRLGRDFFLAAATCGLAIAIKLVGFFFVFALAGYVIAAWWVGSGLPGFNLAGFRRAALRSAGFIALMSLVVLLSNPFLFYASQREKLVQIQAYKTQELAYGYPHDDPTYYQKGPIWWEETLQVWYGPVPFLLLLVGLAAYGAVRGERQLANRLILAWVLPYSVYLLYFVAVKPDHYWLPVALPLFSVALNAVRFPKAGPHRRVWWAVSALLLIVLVWQFTAYLGSDVDLYLRILGAEAAEGY